MNGKNSMKETELIDQIRDYKRQFRGSLKEKLSHERDARHRKNEVLLEGVWISKEKLDKVQSKLQKKESAICIETYLIIFFMFIFNLALFLGFRRFFLP